MNGPRRDILERSQEIEETGCWLELLRDAEITTPEQITDILSEARELTAILVANAKTVKARLKRAKRTT